MHQTGLRDTPTPYRPETLGSIESAVREASAVEGTVRSL